MRAYERLLNYVQYDTASCEGSATHPSTEGQLVLGRALVREMLEMGITDARIDAHGYVYGSLPATAPNQPTIGLIAHMDTVSEVPCMPMHARVVPFDGSDVALEAQGCVLSPMQFPELNEYRGHHLVVTDGRTILGADDKAGIAEILTACESLLTNPSIPHGRVAIAFTPDEEIGSGADAFDVAGFGAAFAYTVDGGILGEIEYENFNAASAHIACHGVNIHPGSAKDKMRNAVLMAAELISLLPAAETPAHTARYEGFYHVNQLSGDVERAKIHLIVRDHDREKFEARKSFLQSLRQFLEGKYGAGTIDLDVKDSYYNMREVLQDKLFIVERAERAMRAAGVTPLIGPIRGGTDGSRLSFMGLPCPNLSTGGMNFHGRYECISVEAMDKMVEVLINLVTAP